MELFFDPQSVVVIGASNTPFNLGSTICNMLKDYLHYNGKVYAVNSKGEAVNGYPGIHRSWICPKPPIWRSSLWRRVTFPALSRTAPAKASGVSSLKAPVFQREEKTARPCSATSTKLPGKTASA